MANTLPGLRLDFRAKGGSNFRRLLEEDESSSKSRSELVI
jgi:hypothetical protein